MATSYLVDTHILIWSMFEPKKLSHEQRDIFQGEAVTFVSVATIWETEIKRSIGKLPLPDDLWKRVLNVGHLLLPIVPDHAMAIKDLPQHHRDPFDRMLVAQAQIEKLTIMTMDKHIRLYDVETV